MHKSNASHRTLAILVLKIGVAALLLITASAWAQSFRGSIRGTVTDPTGSVIAGAKVTAKNIATGLQREATTGDDGAYVLAELPAGEYTVRAESTGLSPSAQNVQVNVGLDTSANFDLTRVQQRHEQMTVTAEAPLVEASRDVLGEVDLGEVVGLVQLLVDQGHRTHAVGHVLEDVAHAGVRQSLGLQGHQAGNDLHVVLHAVMDFLQQYFLLGERSPDTLLSLIHI